MSVDTQLKLKGRITAEQIVDYITEHYKFISNEVKEENYGSLNQYDWVEEKYDDSNEWKIINGAITFRDGDENRSLFYYYQNVNSYENLEYYSKYNLEDMVKSETTFLSLNCYDNSVEIMKGIAQEFGGWLDENDCDDIPPYWIDKVKKKRYCWSDDGEYYMGSFDTEQEAIEDAKKCIDNLYERHIEHIYIGTFEIPTLEWCSNEERIIESMYELLNDECGESSENFEITREQEKELAKRIDQCVAQWIKDMNIKPNCYTIKNIHLVDLRWEYAI